MSTKLLIGSLLFICLSIAIGANALESEKKFTNDWFAQTGKAWDSYKSNFDGLPNQRCLEIGSFEGRSTIYLAENFCNGEGSFVDSVDTWEGSDEHSDLEKNGLFERFTHNAKDYLESGRVQIHRQMSSDALLTFVQEVRSGKREKYDFIYIDASHIAKDVLMDAVLSWELLKIDGLMFFDDYEFGTPHLNMPWLFPKPAIDGFLNSYATLYEVLEKSYQLRIKKLAESPLFPSTREQQEIIDRNKTIEDESKRRKKTFSYKIKQFYNNIINRKLEN